MANIPALLFLSLSIGALLATVPRADAAYARKRVSACEAKLSPKAIKSNRARLAAIFSEGAEVEDHSVAFVGVARDDLSELADLGQVPIAITRYVPHFVTGNAALARYRRANKQFEYGLDHGDDPWELAVRDARARTHARLVTTRIPKVVGLRDKLVSLLMLLPIDQIKTPTFSPRFRQLVDAAETAKITRHDDELWPHTRGLARALGVSWAGINDEISEARKQLTSVFADLPTRGGYVLALKESAIPNLLLSKESLPALRTLAIDDVLAIEPMSPEDFHFMDARMESDREPKMTNSPRNKADVPRI